MEASHAAVCWWISEDDDEDDEDDKNNDVDDVDDVDEWCLCLGSYQVGNSR